jgi:hypothetical protein
MIAVQRLAHAAVERPETAPRLIAALVLFSIYAYLVAPFSFGDSRTLAPHNLESDAMLGTLLLGSGMTSCRTTRAPTTTPRSSILIETARTPSPFWVLLSSVCR